MTTYIVTAVVALIVGAAFGVLTWQLFIAGPEVHAADIAHADIAAKLLNAQEQKRQDDAEYNRLYAESIEIVAEWKAALEKAEKERDEARAEAGKRHNARDRFAVATGGVPAAPVATEAVMAPQETDPDEGERSFFDVIQAHLPVDEYHSGFTGQWPKAEFAAAIEAAQPAYVDTVHDEPAAAVAS